MDCTHRHVIARAGKSAGDRVNRLSTDAKVAQLDCSVSGQDDIAGFDVTVDNMPVVKVIETAKYLITGQHNKSTVAKSGVRRP